MVEGSTDGLAPCPHCRKLHDETLLRCPRTDLPLPLEGRLIDGKFRVVGPLGTGGMAAVWLAINEAVDRQVAIKLLRPETARSEELLARFRAEARAAGRIDNEHICEVLDFGNTPIGPYIVMERLQGQDLASLIKAAGHLQPAWAVWIVRQALSGLGAAHRAGIVHRDLKPGNLFLHEPKGARKNRDVIVKIMDFGVSKFLDGRTEAETQSGVLLGTPEYMAPEQLKGAGRIDARADIFAMGAILYRALTGKQVFSGPNLAAVLMSMAHDDPAPISDHVDGVPGGLAKVVERCLERDPAKRFDTAEALSDALAPYDDREELGDLQAAAASQSTAKADHATTVIYDGPPPAPKGRRTMWIMVVVTLFVIATGVFYASTRPANGVVAEPETTAETEGEHGQTESAVARAANDVGGPARSPSPTPAAPQTEPEGETESSATEPDAAATDGGTEPDLEDDGTDTSASSGNEATKKPPRPAPPGSVRGGAFITPIDPGPAGDQKQATRHCKKLGSERYLGQSRWSLANPTQARLFTGERKLKTARYWTSAVHAGRALVISLPGGKKHSERLDRRARPLCVVRY